MRHRLAVCVTLLGLLGAIALQAPTAQTPFRPSGTEVLTANLAWSTYLGGDQDDNAWGIALDSSGNVLVVGATKSSGWVSGGYDTSFNGGTDDAFVAKLSATGQLVWSTYLGGSGNDYAEGVAVDSSSNVFVIGTTGSSDWVSGGPDTTYHGLLDGFLVKLSSSGAHVWSTYLGGTHVDAANGVTVDGSGNVIVGGATASTGWISGGFDTAYDGATDAFVAKLSNSGANLWSTYVGGSYLDKGIKAITDTSGNILLTGSTASSGWVSGGYDTTYNGGTYDAFVVKLSSSGAHLWSTYVGGSDSDSGEGIAVDGAGNVFAVGGTSSTGWVSGGFNTTYRGNGDVYVVKMSSSGAHLWSTYLGGSSTDSGYDVVVDGSRNALVAGYAGSSDWCGDPHGSRPNGNSDGFVTKLSASGKYSWTIYVGGNGDDYVQAIKMSASGSVFIAGTTGSAGWVSGGYDTTFGGVSDAFAAKMYPPQRTQVPSEEWNRY
jgi:hypothetical protein